MDPLSILGTVLTIGQIANSIKASIDKVKLNKKRLDVLVGDIIKSLDDLERFSNAHNEEVGRCEQLRGAVRKLERDMATLLTHCHKLVPRNGGSKLSKVKASVKAWSKGDELEAEMIRIKESIASCYAQFTAFTSARVESAAYRMENTMVVQRVEQSAHFHRLEVLFTNVALDTGFGKQVVQQVARVIGEFPNNRGIEHDYLCLQLDKTLDMLETHPSYRGPIVETLTDDFNPAFEPQHILTVPHEFVVTDLLLLSRNVRASSYSKIYDLARDLEETAGQLHDLLLFREAINAMKTAVQLFRNLVAGGGPDYLPSLAHALKNLSVQLQIIGQSEEALLASQDAIDAMRLVVQNDPNQDFRPNLALTLRCHGDALVLDGRGTEALPLFAESIALYGEMIGEIQVGTRPSSFTILFAAASVCLSHSETLFYQGEPLEAFELLKRALLYLSLVSVGDFNGHALWNVPSRVFSHARRILYPLYSEGASLSLLDDVVVLYQKLSLTDSERFSEQFMRCLYFYAYLCRYTTPHGPDSVVLEANHLFIFQLVFDANVYHSNVDHVLGATSLKPAIGRLQKSEEGVEAMERAIQVYVSSQANPIFRTSVLSDNCHQLIVTLCISNPDAAMAAIHDAATDLQEQQPAEGPQDNLKRTILLLRDIPRRIQDPAIRTKILQCADSTLEIIRTGPQGSNSLLVIFLGEAFVNLGEVCKGMAVVEEGIKRCRDALAEAALSNPQDFLVALSELSLTLFQKGDSRVHRAIQCYQHILGIYVSAEEADRERSEGFPLPHTDALASTLINLAALSLQSHSPSKYESFARHAHDLLSDSYTTLPRKQSSLYLTLIHCLLRGGASIDAILETHFESKMSTALEEAVELASCIEDQFKAYEDMIHFYALQNLSESVDDVVQKAYALHKDAIGGEINLATLGLRHDTLAVIASHYGKLGRSENVLPFATAAVVTSKSRPRDLMEDTPYLESICDVAAYLWNLDRREDATALLGSVVGAWQADLGSEASRDSVAVGGTLGSLEPERLRESLRAYVDKQIQTIATDDKSGLSDDDAQSDIALSLEKLAQLTDRYFEFQEGRLTEDSDSVSDASYSSAHFSEDISAGNDLTANDQESAALEGTHQIPSSIDKAYAASRSDQNYGSDDEAILAFPDPDSPPLSFSEHQSSLIIPLSSDNHPLRASSPNYIEISASNTVAHAPPHEHGHSSLAADHEYDDLMRGRSTTSVHMLSDSFVSVSSEFKVDSRQPLPVLVRHWLGIVANALVISWTVGFMVIFLSRSIFSNSNSSTILST